MVRIDGPTVQPDVPPVSMALGIALLSVVALLTQGLQRPGPKQGPVSTVWGDVVSDLGRDHLTHGHAELAQGLGAQLVGAHLAPLLEFVPLAPIIMRNGAFSS